MLVACSVVGLSGASCVESKVDSVNLGSEEKASSTPLARAFSVTPVLDKVETLNHPKRESNCKTPFPEKHQNIMSD